MTTATARPRISFVIPLFNEQENLPELHRRLRAALLSESPIALQLPKQP